MLSSVYKYECKTSSDKKCCECQFLNVRQQWKFQKWQNNWIHETQMYHYVLHAPRPDDWGNIVLGLPFVCLFVWFICQKPLTLPVAFGLYKVLCSYFGMHFSCIKHFQMAPTLTTMWPRPWPCQRHVLSKTHLVFFGRQLSKI